MRMAVFEQRDDELFQEYLDVIFEIYEQDNLRGTDITHRLESAFLLGTKSKNAIQRAKFLDKLEQSLPRTLDGRPAPGYSASSSGSAKKAQPKKKGLATLSSLGGGGHDHDDDDSDDDDDDPHRDTYAGGEKSGLAVQDPNSAKGNAQRILDDLLAKARS